MSEMFELDNFIALFFVECTCSGFEATFTINGCSMASEEEARSPWSLHSKNCANDTRFFSVSSGNFLLWIFQVMLCLLLSVFMFSSMSVWRTIYGTAHNHPHRYATGVSQSRNSHRKTRISACLAQTHRFSDLSVE